MEQDNSRSSKATVIFQAALEFVKVRSQNLELSEEDRGQIRQAFSRSFKMSEEELQREIAALTANGTSSNNSNGHATREQTSEAQAITLEQELDGLLPRSGFLRDYVDYTRRSEAPLAYHVFSCFTALGSTINRRVWFDMGYYRVFPAMGIIIIGPSGIKKTSAANIAVDLLRDIGVVKVYSEKLTPEALIDAMKGDSTGLLYAPEMTVFLNKVKYMEGMVQLITRFMDCPDKWESGTIMRGKHALTNVAISSLMCSTSDWFIRSTPEDSFGGGFIARNLLVVQEASARCEPIPVLGNDGLYSGMVQQLSIIHSLEGQIKFTEQTDTAYKDWYRGEHQDEAKQPEHEMLATYFQRKPDHAKRLAICLHLAHSGGFDLCLDCWERSLRLLNWTEGFIPRLLQQMFKTSSGEEQEQVLRTIRAHGIIRHSDLVRRLGYRMDAQRVKSIITSLKEGGQLIELNDPLFGHAYKVKEHS